MAVVTMVEGHAKTAATADSDMVLCICVASVATSLLPVMPYLCGCRCDMCRKPCQDFYDCTSECPRMLLPCSSEQEADLTAFSNCNVKGALGSFS